MLPLIRNFHRLFLLATLLSAGAFGAELKMGVAAVKITPPLGAPMAGYYHGRAADGVHDDLFAKAIVLDDGKTRVAIVACDIVSLSNSVVTQARKYIADSTGIPAGHVMISATHAHTGPEYVGRSTLSRFQGEMLRIAQAYADELPLKIAESVQKASVAMKDVTLYAAMGEEASLPFNRRYHMKDGTVGWNPGRGNPNIVRPAGPIDPAVPIVVATETSGKPLAAYVNYAMHLDTVGGTKFSADYAATLSNLLAAAKSPDLLTMFTYGCAGNVNHIDVSWREQRSGNEEAARIGTVLAASVLRAWKGLTPVTDPQIGVHSEIVQLPLPAFSEADLQWANKIAATYDTKEAAPFIDLVKAFRIIDLVKRNGKPLDAEVQVIAVGDSVAWVGLPGEIFTEFGMAIRQSSPFRFTAIAGLANGSVGYVPNRKAYIEGAYEVVSARCAPGSGESLVDSATRQLVQLHRLSQSR